MNANKYIILLSILILLPLCAKAQRFKSVTERQADQIGKNVYVTTAKDTTLVVNFISKGLNTPDTKFLHLDKSNNAALDSLFHKKLDYTSEEAMLDMNQLILELEKEKKEIKGNNDALSFRLASKSRDLRAKELEARELVEAVKSNKPKEELSAQELAALYLKFGDKPTYYINGAEVPASVVNQLQPTEIIEKDMRIKGTVSGNPNGEVWISVTEKALDRIKIPNTYINYPTQNSLDTYIEEVKKVEREKEREDLKSLPVVKRETTSDGKQIDREVATPKENDNATYGKGTRVLKRTVSRPGSNNSNTSVTTPSSTQQRSSIPVVRKSSQDDATNAETPKKSVRRIKERHENK